MKAKNIKLTHIAIIYEAECHNCGNKITGKMVKSDFDGHFAHICDKCGATNSISPVKI